VESPSASSAAAAPALRSRILRVLLRWGGPAAYGIALLTVAVAHGLPLSKDRLLIWIVLGLLSFSLTDVRRWLFGLVFEWLPFAAILFVYDLARGAADGLLRTNVRPQIDADRALFDGHVPTEWLQRNLWHGSAHLQWYDYAAWSVYLTHFFGTLIAAGILWHVAHHRFRRYVAMVSVLSLAGFATYVLFPAAPPWWAYAHHQLGPVHRLVRPVFMHMHFVHFDAVFEKGAHFANPVAAMPSLHAAFALLIAIYFWRMVPLAVRPLLAAYPVAMAFALVYTGEHYVIDCVVGWVYAVVAYWGVNRLADRRAARRSLQVAIEPLQDRLEAHHPVRG
jgi:membrane-associated phospholipid phosphatase